MGIKGKVALVTGGSAGIGKATVERFIKEGAKVAFCASHAEPGNEMAKAIKQAGGDCLFMQVDVTVPEQVVSMVKKVEDHYGKIDILVNNAGLGKSMVFAETTEADWQPVIALNFYGPLRVTRAVLPGMIKNGGGSIVNLSSDAGRAGDGNQAIYGATKGGMLGLTKSLARELVKHKIRVNCVSPGPTNTERIILRNEREPARAVALARLIPMRRSGDPAEVAAAIYFFASDEASYITGQIMSVNGGMIMPG